MRRLQRTYEEKMSLLEKKHNDTPEDSYKRIQIESKINALRVKPFWDSKNDGTYHKKAIEG